MSDLPTDKFFVPLCIIDITDRVVKNVDSEVMIDDIYESINSRYIIQHNLIRYQIASALHVQHVGELNTIRTLSCVLQTSRLLHYKYNIATINNIYYTDTQTLNIHYSSNKNDDTHPDAPKPIFIYIHGGALILGSNNNAALSILYTIAHADWLVITINYRLLPKHKYPAPLNDCVSAVQWCQSNAAQYNGDSNCIVVGGESAGATLALLTTLHSTACNIKGCVDIHGPTDYTTLLNGISRYDMLHNTGDASTYNIHDISPQHIIDTFDTYCNNHIDTMRCRLVPLYCIHGSNDTLVSINDTGKYYKSLQWCRQQYNVYNDVNDILIELPHTQHIFANAVGNINVRVYGVADSIVIWLNEVYKSYHQSNDQITGSIDMRSNL